MKHESWRLLVSAYRDGELAPEDRARVEAHLAQCPECAQVLADYRRMGEALKQLPRREPSRDLWYRVRAALPVRRSARPFWVRLVPVASAAMLLLVALTVFLYQYQGLGRAGRAPQELAAPEGPAGPGLALPSQETPTPMLRYAPQPAVVPTVGQAGGVYAAKAGCPGEVLALELVALAKRIDETIPSPRLEGTLYDASGRPLPGVTLVITDTAGWTGSAVTASDGRFGLLVPGPGNYRVTLALVTPPQAVTEDSGLPLGEGEAVWSACPSAGPTLPLILLQAHEVAILTLRGSGL